MRSAVRSARDWPVLVGLGPPTPLASRWRCGPPNASLTATSTVWSTPLAVRSGSIRVRLRESMSRTRRKPFGSIGIGLRELTSQTRRKPSAGFGPGTRCARSLRSRACIVRVPEAGLALSVHQDAGWSTGCPWWTERASGARRCPDPASREGPEVPRPARAAAPREDTAGPTARGAQRGPCEAR